ncbi:hypothetical protein ACVR0O_06900 [Streptococcus caviae]|uniref:hypothetical protein n=1 Tax=Streptococcus sp. 'caviae' TaxID=1915004 RepID=UPI00094B7F9B|nr:hypothetical protein [Streptococcus sp. 'caviae']OLN83183.1 hypothetical protein BMI76_06240 [Streptococcus sp. 'caviae']
MRRKSSFIICTAIIIISNILMMTVINNGEEKLSNLFVIAITLVCFPGFLWAIDNGMTSLIRIESSALLLLAILSAIRLINRIDTLPTVVNSTVVIIALGLITVLLVAGIVRWINKRKG